VPLESTACELSQQQVAVWFSVQLAEHQHDSNCFLLHTGLEQDGRGHSHSVFAFVLCNFPKSSPKMQIGRTTLILYFCMLVDLPSTI
jgi:hypothetical protein